MQELLHSQRNLPLPLRLVVIQCHMFRNRFGWNWTGGPEKIKLTTVEVQFSEITDYSFINFHTRQLSCKRWDQPVSEFSERISQIYGLKQKKKKHASKLKGEPSKLDEQTLPKAIPQFPCKFPEQLLCIQVLAKEYSQPNCFLATSCVVRSIAAFFFFCPCKAFAT